MPVVSRFYGIVIKINCHDHLPPHIHAEYNGVKAFIDIKTLEMKGKLPPNARRMVVEWVLENRDELVENWEKAVKGILPKNIKPLE